MSKKHVSFLITGLPMLFSIMPITGFIGIRNALGETVSGEKAEIVVEQHQNWKSNKADSDLVKVVNFLINNKGKEIELAGEKHKITGNEEIDVTVKVLACCKMFFNEGVNAVHAYGKIKDSSFEEGSVNALIPAQEIPEMEASSSILEIDFDSKAKDYWMQVLE